jgi:multicomponent K+:H+ antiporter subunit D
VSAHLPLLPIVWPLLVAATLLLVAGCGIRTQRIMAWTGLCVLVLLSALLVAHADRGGITVYLLGDWPARLGISLLVDRLAAWMVLVTALLAVPSLLFACAGWDRRAMHFHALFQLQLMGLNGAFLTGDLFNLFVFFEILLAASYGLLLSGGRGGRMRVGFHYLSFNIAASTLFLVALGLVYGLLGSLNMAELAARVAATAPEDLAVLQSVAGLMLVVFCAKAALLPLYLWLPGTYARAPAAIAALFVILTKVGLYAVLRVYGLLFGEGAGALAGFAWDWLLPVGLATLVLAGFGAMAAIRLRVLTAYLVLQSAGTLFVAFALAQPDSIGAGLYYLAHSTFACAALFLITELVRRHRGTDRTNVSLTMLQPLLPGVLFVIAAISVIGLPPLSGFIGKFALMAAVPEAWTGWVWSCLLLSSFFVLVALMRTGSRLFWSGAPSAPPAGPAVAARRRVGQHIEYVAVAVLLAYGVAMTLGGAPMVRYARAAGEQLADPGRYVEAVRATTPQLRGE